MVPFDSTTSDRGASSASATVSLLTSIWQSLLHRSPIGVDDNFFSLGGNRRIADLLFADIARKMGREVPGARIFHAQTIAALAFVLDQSTLPRFSPFVQIKAGTKEPPILIAPGLDGCTSFSKLAKGIQTEHPIYGIQAKGVDGMENPFDCVEDMAQYYVEGLNELQPYGPYILIGYSFGGLAKG
jgi:acetoacetyl-CoA synthetase